MGVCCTQQAQPHLAFWIYREARDGADLLLQSLGHAERDAKFLGIAHDDLEWRGGTDTLGHPAQHLLEPEREVQDGQEATEPALLDGVCVRIRIALGPEHKLDDAVEAGIREFSGKRRR